MDNGGGEGERKGEATGEAGRWEGEKASLSAREEEG